MTTREHLNLQRRRASLAVYPGFLIFAGGMALSDGRAPLSYIGFCGFALFIGGVLAMMFGGRCLHCRRLSLIFYQSGGSLLRIVATFVSAPIAAMHSTKLWKQWRRLNVDRTYRRPTRRC